MQYIFVTLFGITGAIVREVQLLNVEDIFVTLFALLISGVVFSLVQPQNVLSIFVTLFGIAGAAVRDLRFSNVLFIFVTLFGIAGAVVRDAQS